MRAEEALRTEQRRDRAKQRPEAQRPSRALFPHPTRRPPGHGAEREIKDGFRAVANLRDGCPGRKGDSPGTAGEGSLSIGEEYRLQPRDAGEPPNVCGGRCARPDTVNVLWVGAAERPIDRLEAKF